MNGYEDMRRAFEEQGKRLRMERINRSVWRAAIAMCVLGVALAVWLGKIRR
jgi:hypothetical protein